MAYERSWPAVPPTQFTSDGSSTGLIQVANTRGFKVKAKAFLQSTTQPATEVEVKRVLSDTQMIVGKVGTPLTDRSFDATAFLVLDGAFVFAQEQEKVKVPQLDREHATYDQEPTTAWRSVLVDQLGRYYETANPLPVQLTDGSINIETLNAELRVQLSSKDNDPKAGDVHSSVRIGDQNGEATITDGALNVNVISGPSPTQALVVTYNNDPTVITGVTSDLVSYTVPAGKQAMLTLIEVSGENIAKYTVLVNSSVKAVKRTYYGSPLNLSFQFGPGNGSGLLLNAGDVVDVQVVHNQPATASFDGSIQVVEIT